MQKRETDLALVRIIRRFQTRSGIILDAGDVSPGRISATATPSGEVQNLGSVIEVDVDIPESDPTADAAVGVSGAAGVEKTWLRCIGELVFEVEDHGPGMSEVNPIDSFRCFC